MKATRAHLLGEFTGKLDGLIYYRSRINGKLYVRRQWTAPVTSSTISFKSANAAIYALQPSDGYIRDLKNYMLQYNRSPHGHEKPLWTWTNAYSKLMFAMQKALPDTVDLKSISREQIEHENLPCRTVATAITAGLLPRVSDWESFTAAL